MWWQPEKERPTAGFRDVGDWFTRLRDAADAELPATMDREHRARLILELVDVMHRIDPAVAQEFQQAPARTNGHARPTQLIVPKQRIQSNGGAKHRADPARTRRRHRARRTDSCSVVRFLRAHKGSQSIIVVSVVVALLGLIGLTMFQPSPAPSLGGGLSGDTAVGGTRVRVGVLPVVDVAPFYQALDAGYFTQEGLDVEAVTVQSGPQTVADLAAGRLDVAFASYPAILQAQSEKRADLKIISPAYTTLPGHLMLVAPPNGSIQKAEDVGGKRIAVTSTGSISDLGAMSQLSTRGVDLTTIHWVPMAMPDMGPAMQHGDVDGAVLAEPYITVTDKSFHARPILDVAVGKTARIPVSGWASQSTLALTTPDIVAGFVRALRRGTDDMTDRARLEPVLVQYLGVNAEIAKEVRIAEFTKVLDVKEIQRVADLMKDFNVIHQPFDVQPMLLSP
jgi:NitT/TauT family transport system substrate-binding protein